MLTYGYLLRIVRDTMYILFRIIRASIDILMDIYRKLRKYTRIPTRTREHGPFDLGTYDTFAFKMSESWVLRDKNHLKIVTLTDKCVAVMAALRPLCFAVQHTQKRSCITTSLYARRVWCQLHLFGLMVRPGSLKECEVPDRIMIRGLRLHRLRHKCLEIECIKCWVYAYNS